MKIASRLGSFCDRMHNNDDHDDHHKCENEKKDVATVAGGVRYLHGGGGM